MSHSKNLQAVGAADENTAVAKLDAVSNEIVGLARRRSPTVAGQIGLIATALGRLVGETDSNLAIAIWFTTQAHAAAVLAAQEKQEDALPTP